MILKRILNAIELLSNASDSLLFGKKPLLTSSAIIDKLSNS